MARVHSSVGPADRRFRAWPAWIVLFEGLAFIAQATAQQPASAPPNGLSPQQRQQRIKESDDLWQESHKLRDTGKLDEAIAAARRSLAIERELFGTGTRVVQSLDYLAKLLESNADFKDAEAVRSELLAEITKHYGKDHWQTTDARLSLEKIKLLESLDVSQRRELAEAEQLSDNAVTLRGKGEFKEVLSAATRAAEIRAKLLGKNHPEYATSLNDLGLLYTDIGDYAKSEPLHREALAIQKKTLGEHHPDYAISLNGLVAVYWHEGKYAKAEPLARQALAIRKDALGEMNLNYAESLNNLATLYKNMGDYAKAEPLYRRALAIRKRVLGEKHLDGAYSVCLNNLATLCFSMGDYAKAVPLFEQSLSIDKELLGEKHPFYAVHLNNLAIFYDQMGDHAKAESLFRKVLEIRKELLGDKHPDYASAAANLASCYECMGDYSKAEPLYRQALAIYREVLGEKHPLFAEGLTALAALYYDTGDYAKSEMLCREALQIARQQLDLTANIQSERQQLRMAETVRWYFDVYLSVSGPANISAQDVYARALDWKGAVSARQEAMRRVRATLASTHSPALVALFDDLAATSRELSNESLLTPKPGTEEAHRRKLAELSDRVEQLQQQLASVSQEFRRHLDQQRRTPDDIRRALPQDTVLVDLLEYLHRAQPTAKGKERVLERRLLAFIVRHDRAVERIELGPTTPIATAIESWRKGFGLANRGQTADPAQELRRLVWDKLEPHLQGAKTVLLSPDGATARFPWPALPGKRPGTYLLEDTAIAIVPIPRLLPELLADNQPVQPEDKRAVEGPSLLLVGDVNFDADPGRAPIETIAQSVPRGARGGQLLQWPSLPGTRTEMVTIADSFEQHFPDGNLKKLRGDGATKGSVVSQLDKYRYVHFATHGFFAPKEFRSALAAAARSSKPGSDDPFGPPDVSGFHPGLLSGLVLAGANHAAEDGKDDGILTALEVGELDLRHVELATLSACETGLGETAGGEGLLGLQRAFQISGAKSVMATLWTIRDDASRSLMIDFYENLWKKKLSKLESLRQAQLTMLREGIKRGLEIPEDQPPDKQRRLPPYYWAAFVLSGDWR